MDYITYGDRRETLRYSAAPRISAAQRHFTRTNLQAIGALGNGPVNNRVKEGEKKIHTVDLLFYPHSGWNICTAD